MCFEFDASPPDLPPGRALRGIAGGAAAESLVLTSPDGNRFAAALAESPEPRGSAVVVLPDVRGLYRFYVELVERLAEAGHHAIALDYFGRTAGAEEREEDFDFSPEVSQTRTETVQLDLAAARSALAERTGATSVVSLGFCFGGTHSFFAGTNPELGLDGVIGFYGLLDPARVGKTNRPNLLERGAGDLGSGPRPVRRRRSGDPGRGRRGLRPPPRYRRRRARDRHLSRRTPLLLRQIGSRARRGVEGCLEPGPRLPRRIARLNFARDRHVHPADIRNPI